MEVKPRETYAAEHVFTIYVVPGSCLVCTIIHHLKTFLRLFLFFQQWQITPPFFLLTIWLSSSSLTGQFSYTFDIKCICMN